MKTKGNEKYYSLVTAPCQHDDVVQPVNYDLLRRKFVRIVEDNEFIIDNTCKFMSQTCLLLLRQASDVESRNWLPAPRHHTNILCSYCTIVFFKGKDGRSDFFVGGGDSVVRW